MVYFRSVQVREREFTVDAAIDNIDITEKDTAQQPAETKSKHIVVADCCRDPNAIGDDDISGYAQSMVNNTFTDSRFHVHYQICNRSGYPIDPNATMSIIPLSDRYQMSLHGLEKLFDEQQQENIWFEPDIYFGVSWFFRKHNNPDGVANEKALDLRVEALEAKPVTTRRSDIGPMNERFNFSQRANVIASHQKEQYRPLLVSINQEPGSGGGVPWIDISLNSVHGFKTGNINVWFPVGNQAESQRSMNNSRQLVVPQEAHALQSRIDSILEIKARHQDRWMSFLQRSEWTTGYDSRKAAALRLIFFDMITEQQGQNRVIDALGQARENVTARAWARRTLPGCRGRDDNPGKTVRDDSTMSCFLPYKFAITFENGWYEDGYWSEKLLNGLHAHTIPVYFGYDSIGKLFNEKRFVNCRVSKQLITKIRDHDYSESKGKHHNVLIDMIRAVDGVEVNLQKCIDRVMEIDGNDDLYHQMLREPVFLNNDFDRSPMSPKVQGRMFKTALREIQSHLLD